MRAYVNKCGHVVTVFCDWHGNYQVYIRRGKGRAFVLMNYKIGKHSTREAAEAAMDKWFKCNSTDKTYKLVENWTDK